MLEIIKSIENLKKRNAEIYLKQVENNFKITEICSMNDYIAWLEEQIKIN